MANTRERGTDSSSTADANAVSTGDEIENPITGNRVTFRQHATDTDGELLRFEVVVAPEHSGELIEFAHIHPRQEQRIGILSGTMRAIIGDEPDHPERYAHLRKRSVDWEAEKGNIDPLTIGEGQEVLIPPQTPHRFWNDRDTEARVSIELRPPLDFERFLREQYHHARTEQTETDAAGS